MIGPNHFNPKHFNSYWAQNDNIVLKSQMPLSLIPKYLLTKK
jgi:hypothetical protein